jgi:plastocyanin
VRRLLIFLVFAPFALTVATRALAADVSFSIADPKAQPIADAVISLVPLDRAPPADVTAAKPEIDQHGQEFSPFVTVVRTGTAVHFPNRDTVEHYVYSESEPKRFQLPLYAPGKNETVVFDRPGVVALGCNIHDWMLAYVVIVDTPWFALTSPNGQATIRDVPNGRYRIEVWHPRARTVSTREFVVDSDRASALPQSFTLALKPDHRIRRPVEGPRGGYR